MVVSRIIRIFATLKEKIWMWCSWSTCLLWEQERFSSNAGSNPVIHTIKKSSLKNIPVWRNGSAHHFGWCSPCSNQGMGAIWKSFSWKQFLTEKIWKNKKLAVSLQSQNETSNSWSFDNADKAKIRSLTYWNN